MFTHRLVFPGSVLRGRGAIKHLGAACGRLGQRAILVGGKRAIASVEERVAKQLEQQMVSFLGSEWYGGECSETQISRLATELLQQGVEVVIATGGGKALDTAKAASVICNIPLITLPTIAGTCSAITPFAYRYYDDGRSRDMLPLARGPAAVVIDADLLVRAPLRWLSAGLGDTLAKWYEYRAISHINTSADLPAVARTHSELCYQLIEHFAGDACHAVRQGKANHALEQVLDAIFLYAGLISIMSNGVHTGAAHALYRGFTHCDKSRNAAHGSLVGFGNLCLLALENRSDAELMVALTLAKNCAIPTRLDDIAADLNDEDVTLIIEHALGAPDMANMPFEVSYQAMKAAITRVHKLRGVGE